MEKNINIKDYLHFYIGSAWVITDKGKYLLSGDVYHQIMTCELELNYIELINTGIPIVKYSPELFRKLLSARVDLFGLIDAGLAIEKNKL